MVVPATAITTYYKYRADRMLFTPYTTRKPGCNYPLWIPDACDMEYQAQCQR